MAIWNISKNVRSVVRRQYLYLLHRCLSFSATKVRPYARTCDTYVIFSDNVGRTVRVRYFAVRWPHYDENKPLCKLLTTKVHRSQHWTCHWISKTIIFAFVPHAYTLFRKGTYGRIMSATTISESKLPKFQPLEQPWAAWSRDSDCSRRGIFCGSVYYSNVVRSVTFYSSSNISCNSEVSDYRLETWVRVIVMGPI